MTPSMCEQNEVVVFFCFLFGGCSTTTLKVVYRDCCTKSLVRVFCEETWRFACQSGREGADGGGAGCGAGGSRGVWDIPPPSAPGGCETALAKR